MIDVTLDAPIGTPHPKATCCWCSAALVVGQIIDLKCWLCPVDYARQAALALIVTGKGKARRCLNVPLPSQALFEENPARNILWGGQAGPGKSHGVRWWLYKRSLTIPGHEALLLRENWRQLEKHHLRKMKIEVPLLGGTVANETAVFPNGSFIDCGHMADDAAVAHYLGLEYNAIVPDEAAQTPVTTEGVTVLGELSTRARKVSKDISGQVVRPRFLPVSNPGGPSAGWLRDMFIDHRPDFERYPALKAKYRPDQWVYIPARLDDNPYQDPEYGDTLAVLSAVRYRQLAEGDWDVFAGAFFGEWEPTRENAPWHVREYAA